LRCLRLREADESRLRLRIDSGGSQIKQINAEPNGRDRKAGGGGAACQVVRSRCLHDGGSANGGRV
jgi:hypothetical protein